MNERRAEIGSALPENLDSLPRLKGFRLRGMEMTRLETFIDAAFAFAISLFLPRVNRLARSHANSVPREWREEGPSSGTVEPFNGTRWLLGVKCFV